MSNPAPLVRALYEKYQARDWSSAAAVLHPDVRLELPATVECFIGRSSVIGLQERYPEPWGDLTVLQVVSDGESNAVAEIEIIGPSAVFRCVAFWQAQDRYLRRGVEYWVTIGNDEPGPR